MDSCVDKRAELRRKRILERGNERLQKILNNGRSDAGQEVDVRSRNVARVECGQPDIFSYQMRDLALDPDLVPSLINEQNVTPDDISDQLSNLSLEVNYNANERTATGTATGAGSVSFKPLSKSVLWIHFMLIIVTSLSAVVFKVDICTSFWMMEMLVLTLCFLFPDLRQRVMRMNLLAVVRTLFDHFLIFTFMHVTSIVIATNTDSSSLFL